MIEVGARGWIPSNVASSLARLGLPAVKNLCGKLGLLAVKSSYVIWLNRFNKDFQTWRISVGDQSAGRGAPFAGDGAVSTNPAGSALDGVVSQAKAQVMPSSEQTLVPSLTPRDHIAMLPLQNLLAAGGEDIKHSGLPSGGSRQSLSSLLRFPSPPGAPTSWRLDRQDINAGSVSELGIKLLQPAWSSPLSDPTLVVPIEKKVLVDGKWLSEGKRSDVQPCSPAYSGGLIVAARDAVTQPRCGDACDADLPLSDDLDAKELIKLVTYNQLVSAQNVSALRPRKALSQGTPAVHRLSPPAAPSSTGLKQSAAKASSQRGSRVPIIVPVQKVRSRVPSLSFVRRPHTPHFLGEAPLLHPCLQKMR